MIRIEHLKKEYPNAVPLKDVNVEINDGDVIAVIGPSGTGKSTLLRCINLLEKPTAGHIWVDDTEVTGPKTDLGKIRQKIGMVFQSFNLFDHMTAIENVMVPQIEILKVSKQEAYDKAVELLKRVNLFQKAFSYPDQLSGGQKQRVAIARTLAMDPEVILFDEPISALDPTMVGEVKAVIRDLTHTGKTMIIVTHDMDFARTIGTRLFFMSEGGIYEEGTPEEVFTNPQREKTREFVNNLKVLEFDIDNKNYDFYGAYTSIDEYCRKNQISYSKTNHIQSIFEELCQGILLGKLEDYKVNFKVIYSQKEDKAEVDVLYGNEVYNVLHEDSIPLKIIKGISSDLVYVQLDEDYKNKLSLIVN